MPRSAAAIDLLNTAGFESYALTGLAGQNSWLTSGTGGSANVQQTVVLDGSNAVRVDRAASAGADRRWYVPVNDAPNHRFVIVDWDMRAEQTVSAAFGPFLGIEAYDYLGDILFVDKGILGSLGIDASTGDVLYQVPGGTLAETGQLASFGAWHHYRIVIDFMSNQYHTFFDSNLLTSSAFVDGSGLNDFTDADIAALAAQADPTSQALPGTAYFDNFRVRDGLAGDYNDDGIVNMADYTEWKQAYGGMVGVAGTSADGNGNLNIDAADYTVWRNNLGASLHLPLLGLGAQAITIPEPSCLVLAITAVLPFLLFRRGCE
jgi:hypothetical protein